VHTVPLSEMPEQRVRPDLVASVGGIGQAVRKKKDVHWQAYRAGSRSTG